MTFIGNIEVRVETIAGQLLRGVQLLQALAPYSKEPAAASKPARDLSRQEAFDLMMYHVIQGDLVLNEPVKLDAKGKISSPAPSGRVKVRATILGVEFFQASLKTNFKNGSTGAIKVAAFDPTPAFAIVLLRLAKFLKKDWGATRIIWGGIGQGADGKRKNCHGEGTCVDFYGAITQRGTFDVLADWTHKPIFLANGKRRGPWGDTESPTYYRLRPAADQPAYQFFLDVYGFATTECTDGNGKAPTSIGMPGRIIHPDFPDKDLREGHEQHMHFQLGEAYL